MKTTRCSIWVSPKTLSISCSKPRNTTRRLYGRRTCRQRSATHYIKYLHLNIRYLHDRLEITFEANTATAENISQRYIRVFGPRKMGSLTCIPEVEPFEAMIVFVRTKQATEEVVENYVSRILCRSCQRRHSAGTARADHHRPARRRF